MTTPHIEAADGAFAKAVLMPGDPKRARHIATTLMDDAELVTAVRGIEGFTGTYKGKPVSVMASGMGMPSASIYATELFRFYGVEAIIRVGTSGAVNPDLKLGDIVVAVGASTDSNMNRMRFDGSDFAAIASFDLLRLADQVIRANDLRATFGNIFSSDAFYGVRPGFLERMAKLQIQAVEMEAAGLYGVAAEEGAEALTIVTVSDLMYTEAAFSSDERETAVDTMSCIALDVAVARDS